MIDLIIAFLYALRVHNRLLGPSYPPGRPALRIDGMPRIDVRACRVRDRSPPNLSSV